MAKVRKQLGILKDFILGFDFVRMKPETIVKGGVPTDGGVHVLAKNGEAYALYLYGGTQANLTLE